jgi:hypothetical protein
VNARLYVHGELVATMPGVPDGTRELIVGEWILGSIDPAAAETLVGVRGRRMVLRENTVDAFDLVPPTASPPL